MKTKQILATFAWLAAIMMAATFTACSIDDNSVVVNKPTLGTTVTVTWDSSNVSDLDTYDEYEKASIKLTCNRDNDNTLSSEAWYYDSGDEESGIVFQVYRPCGFTFSNTLGKKFIKIEMTLAKDTDDWGPAACFDQLGSGWPSGDEAMYNIDDTQKVTWTGNAATVDLLTDIDKFTSDPVSSIVFYLTD